MTDYEIEMELGKARKAFQNNNPVNLSYWEPGSDYKSALKRILKNDIVHDIFDYQCYLPYFVKKTIQTRLGISSEDFEKTLVEFFPQSTLSIVTLAAFLSKRNLKLGIVAPAYFTVQSCCENFKIPHIIFNDFIQDFNATFDTDRLLQSDCDVFWFTSPINSTSVYFDQNVTSGIQKLLDSGRKVILDESLCLSGKELLRTYGVEDNLFYIYSPHKTLGFQGIMFSVLVTHQKYYAEFNSLKDCYGGSLNASCLQGSAHFVSPNFDECVDFYNNFWQGNLKFVERILAQYEFAHISPKMAGHYAMIFIDHPIEDKNFVDAMKVLMKEKGYFAFPGKLQGFKMPHLFSFRLNLLLDRDDLEKGLTAVLDRLRTLQ